MAKGAKRATAKMVPRGGSKGAKASKPANKHSSKSSGGGGTIRSSYSGPK